jgi:hypothetical protein
MERLVLPTSAHGPGRGRFRSLLAAGLGALAVATPAALLPAQAVAGPEESSPSSFGKATGSGGLSGELTISSESLTLNIQLPGTAPRSR